MADQDPADRRDAADRELVSRLAAGEPGARATFVERDGLPPHRPGPDPLRPFCVTLRAAATQGEIDPARDALRVRVRTPLAGVPVNVTVSCAGSAEKLVAELVVEVR